MRFQVRIYGTNTIVEKTLTFEAARDRAWDLSKKMDGVGYVGEKAHFKAGEDVNPWQRTFRNGTTF